MTQSIDNSEWVMQGVIRDPITGALLRVNADGSINVSGGGAGGGVGTGTTVTGNASITMNTNGIAFNGSNLAGVGFTSTTTAGTAVVATINSGGLSLGVPAYLTTAGTAANSNNAGTGITTGFQAGTLLSATLNSNGLSFVNAEPVISSFEFFAPANSSTLAVMDGVSVSAAMPFQLPQAGSFSFLRFPISLTTNSTTVATTGASLSASVNVLSTWQAVVYSLGTGGNSRSLQSVASGSVGWTVQNSISVAANGTQYSITQAISYGVEGNNTNSSSSYVASQTNMSFVTTNIHTVFSGNRYIDINFANSLSAGPYWVVFGYSSSSATNSTGIQPASNCNLSFSNMQGAAGINIGPRVMGSTNSANPLMGGASFSTAGGGTTASLPISALTLIASNARIYMQLLRSA